MTFIPNPANYSMKGNAPVATAQDVQELPSLDSLSREELIALIKRVSGAMGWVCSMTQEETAQAMLDKLALEALGRTAQAKDCISAINAWLDRTQGKAVQRMELKAQVATFDADRHRLEVEKQAEDMLLRLAAVTISGSG